MRVGSRVSMERFRTMVCCPNPCRCWIVAATCLLVSSGCLSRDQVFGPAKPAAREQLAHVRPAARSELPRLSPHHVDSHEPAVQRLFAGSGVRARVRADSVASGGTPGWTPSHAADAADLATSVARKSRAGGAATGHPVAASAQAGSNLRGDARASRLGGSRAGELVERG